MLLFAHRLHINWHPQYLTPATWAKLHPPLVSTPPSSTPPCPPPAAPCRPLPAGRGAGSPNQTAACRPHPHIGPLGRSILSAPHRRWSKHGHLAATTPFCHSLSLSGSLVPVCVSLLLSIGATGPMSAI